MTLYRLFEDTPALLAASDTGQLTLATEFYLTAPAWATELRYLQPSNGTPERRTAAIYRTHPTNGITGELVAGPFLMPEPTNGEWTVFVLPSAVPLTPGDRYRVAVYHPAGNYAATAHYFDTGEGALTRTRGPVVIPNFNDAAANNQGGYVYGAGIAFPDAQFNATAYYSDVTLSDVDPDAAPPLAADVELLVGAPAGHLLTIADLLGHSFTAEAPKGHSLAVQGGDAVHLPASGREYARFTVNVPASTALEVSFDGVAWVAMDRPNDTTARVLVAGPAATGNPAGTAVLAPGRNAAQVRLTSNPEVVIRPAGSVYVYTP